MKGTIWCLHGAVGHAADWKAFAIAGWAVKRVDLWRFLDCCPMTLAEFGRALNDEARTTPGKNVLLGYSLGGRLALHALLAGNFSWDGAVIVSAHPGLETEEDRSARRAADAEWAARALQGEWSDFLAAWNAQPVLGGAGGGMADRRLLAQRRREIGRSFVDWSLGAQEPLWDRLGGIQIPVLWACGGLDAKFRALAAEAVPRFPAAELAVFPESGHRVPWEVPAAFAERVSEWLGRADG